MPTIIALILCSFLIDFILKRRNLLSLFSFVSVFYSFRNIKQLLIAFVCNNLAAMHLKFFRLPPPLQPKKLLCLSALIIITTTTIIIVCFSDTLYSSLTCASHPPPPSPISGLVYFQLRFTCCLFLFGFYNCKSLT